MFKNKNPFLSAGTKSKKAIFVDFIQTIVIALAFSLVLYFAFLVPSVVVGPSMEPNYYTDDLLFGDKMIQWLGETAIGERLDYNYKRGDVIIFSHQDTNLIKRVIATQGDTVSLKNQKVFVNGKEIVEEYLPQSRETSIAFGPIAFIAEEEVVTVPEDSYFVLGDNRRVSKDSRYAEVGFISRSQVKGKIFLKYWPIKEFQIIKQGEYQEL